MNSQHGAVSILTVSFAALLILIITTSLATLNSGELRNAIDNESSIKAYYAAEGGAEEVSLAVKSYIHGNGPLKDLNQGCDSPAILSSVPGVKCAVITAYGNMNPVVIKAFDTREYDLSNYNPDISLTGVDFDTIEVSWDSPDGLSEPPIMEMMLINYPRDPANPLGLQTSFAQRILDPDPARECLSCQSTPAQFFFNPDPAHPEQYYIGAYKTESGLRYHTKLRRSMANLTGDPAKDAATNFNSVLRFRARDKDVKFKFQLYKNNTLVNAIYLEKTQVDVTANIGGASRRVQLEVPALGSPVGLNDVIFGNNEACKDFQVTSAPGIEDTFSARQCSVQ